MTPQLLNEMDIRHSGGEGLEELAALAGVSYGSLRNRLSKYRKEKVAGLNITPGSPVLCAACGDEISDKAWAAHHTQYKPEKVVPVHRKCHAHIHVSGDYPELLAPDAVTGTYVPPKLRKRDTDSEKGDIPTEKGDNDSEPVTEKHDICPKKDDIPVEKSDNLPGKHDTDLEPTTRERMMDFLDHGGAWTQKEVATKIEATHDAVSKAMQRLPDGVLQRIEVPNAHVKGGRDVLWRIDPAGAYVAGLNRKDRDG